MLNKLAFFSPVVFKFFDIWAIPFSFLFRKRVEPQFVALLILSLSTFIISLGWSSMQLILNCNWYVENRKTLCLVVLNSLLNLNSLSYFSVRPGYLLLATSL